MTKEKYIPRTALVACSRLVDLAGAEIASLEIAQALRDFGVEVELAALEIGAPVAEEIKLLGIKCIDLSATSIAGREFDLIWVSHYVVAYHLLIKEELRAKTGVYSSLSHFEPLETPPMSSILFSRYIVNSEENFSHFVTRYSHFKERLGVFPNAAPANFVNTYREYIDSDIKSIAVISNHQPSELTELIKLLRSDGIEADLIGIQGRKLRVTPEILSHYSAVITIGKTVQYCLVTGTPVFCYDHFGGPGWIRLESFDAAARKNFSGRCTPLRRTAESILVELLAGFSSALNQREALRDLARTRFDLAENLLNVLAAASKSSLVVTMAATDREVLSRESSLFLNLRHGIANYQQAVAERDGQIASLNQQIGTLNQAIAEGERQTARLISSRSWRLTKPLRFLGRVLRGELKTAIGPFMAVHLNKVANVIRQARTATRYVIRGDFDGLSKRIMARNQSMFISGNQIGTTSPFDQKCWGIMTTPHTLFIAHLIADRLRGHGWIANIMTEVPIGFPHDWYVVICPQMFAKIPPGQKRIVFQLEQSVSSRWFIDGYLEMLKNSIAVLEYALVNIEFMAGKGITYPYVYYLPVGASATYWDSIRSSEKTCDVLFYGDSKSSARRGEMLRALKNHFNVRVVTEVFGQEMVEAICQAKVIVNLHYYENALLETPRIHECLSLGVPVVSESAHDQDDYPELIGAVRFFEQGSIPAMLDAVRAVLEEPVSTEKIAASTTLSAQRFAFMFDRFLVGMGFLPASYVSNVRIDLAKSTGRIALSLPETIRRRRMFEMRRPAGCAIFDGMRRCPGWVGCGLSYVALAQDALKQGRGRLNIMEDDVLLPADFEAKMCVVHEFLDLRSGQWDIFAGIIAALHPDVKVISVEVFKGITFATINKMTSTVFNIYSEKALRLLASWNPECLNVASNTIDRYLESQANLQVVITLPFLVGHREEAHSTLWGFENSQYNDMFKKSEQTLEEMVLAQHHDI